MTSHENTTITFHTFFSKYVSKYVEIYVFRMTTSHCSYRSFGAKYYPRVLIFLSPNRLHDIITRNATI